MATWDSIASTIRSRINTNFGTTYDIAFDNMARIPASGTENAAGIWMRVSTKFADSDRAELGAGTSRSRTIGAAFVQLFAPDGDGTGDLLEVAESVAGFFRDVTVSEVTFRTPKVINVGPRGDEYQVNVQAPFYSDEVY